MRAIRQGDQTRRLVLIALMMGMVGFLLAYAPIASNAGTAYGNWGGYSVGGVSYQNRAWITTSAGSAGARTDVKPTSGCAPAGYMGVRARLFTSGGSLVQESSIAYNSGCASLMTAPSNRSASGTWYSYGVTWGFNGSGYNAYYTFISPNQSS